MKIVSVRIDDACPRMNSTKFDKMVAAIEAAGIKGLIGIVPDCRDVKLNQTEEDPLFWEKMRELQQKGWVLAQHGYTHVYDIKARNLVACRKDSEFAGHSYSVQKEKIQMGKEILNSHGIFTDVFFAPAHTYDRNTLRALRDSEFRFVSDGCTKKCYKWFDMKMIPCRIQGLPKKRHKGVLTIVTHPCAMEDKEFDEYIEFFEKHRDELSDYSRLMNQPVSMSFFMRLEEKGYVVFLRYIRPWLFPFLIRMKQCIVKLISNIR